MAGAVRGFLLGIALWCAACDDGRHANGPDRGIPGGNLQSDGGQFPGGGVDLGGNAFVFDLSGVDLAGLDLAGIDLANAPDLAKAGDLANGSVGGNNPVTGGACSSGATGATALRVHWVNSGGTATVQYETWGLPDKSREKVSAYSATGNFSFTPPFDDPYLGDGGLRLDSSDFVDIELSTGSIGTINKATLSILGRSFDTTTSGSFSWQSNAGTGSAPDDLVANSAPYEWYSADATTELPAGNNALLFRIKAGPSSGSLIVNRIEICLDAR
jgi:hypothetical protein